MARIEERGAISRKPVCPLFLFVLAIVVVMMNSSPSEGALISGDYQINWDQDVDKKVDGTTDIRKFKQTLNLKYKGFMSPLVRNEVTFKFEQEINSNAADVTRILPTLDLGFRGKYWEAKAGGKRTHENSDEPGSNPKITDAYFGEFFYQPKKNVPDLKAKYTLDTDLESGVTDTVKRVVTTSSIYKPQRWLELKGEYTRETLADNLKPDSDTESEKSNGSIGVQHMLTGNLKLDAQYTIELSRGATLLEGGGATGQKEDQLHTAKSAMSYRPFETTSVDASYDFSLAQNKASGEHTLTKTAKATGTQKIWTPIEVKGEVLRTITELRHSADDNIKTEVTKTVTVTAKFTKQLDFSFKYERKHTDEPHVDESKSLTSGSLIKNATWTGELAPFWKATAVYDLTDTITNEVKTTVDTKYTLKSTFDFKPIKLTLDPSLDILLRDDFQKMPATSSATRDFKFKILYAFLTTRTVDAKVDHTYGRKTDSLKDNIQRSDATTGNVTFKEPLPGWTVSFDATRQATDTSEDADPPDINSTFGVKADFKYEWLSLNTSFKYDKKTTSSDTELFDVKAGWTAPRWETTLTYSYTKTLSENIDEGYTISLMFKYNL